MKKIIILGATGQIGKIVFKRLKREPFFIVTGTSREQREGFFQFDPFKDPWSLLGKKDVIINCIGIMKETKEYNFEKVHIELASLLMSKRSLLGNPVIMQLSALGASAQHPAAFLRTKGIADEYLLKFPGTLIIRPSIVCTTGTRLVKKLLLLRKLVSISKIMLLPKGFIHCRIQPVMPDDLSDIVSSLIIKNKTKGIINVTGPEEISYAGLIQLLFSNTGKKYRTIQAGRKTISRIVRYFIHPFFPALLTNQEYELLFENNTASASDAELYLGRPLQSTLDFWKTELKQHINA